MNESILRQAVTISNRKTSYVADSMQSTTIYTWSKHPVSTAIVNLNATVITHINDQNSTDTFAHPLWATITIGAVLGAMILATIIGNLLVCIAVAIVKKLRTPSNLLIVSLAVSDLLVAVFVMPIVLLTNITGHWVLDKITCDIWVSLDVLFCTASILNLCMISIDRYFAITRPLKYAIKRTPRRMAFMIAIVWTTSVAISISPSFYFKNVYIENKLCVVSQHIAYQIYATCGSFYLPLVVMIGVYYRIYVISLRLSASENKSKVLARHYETHRLLQNKKDTNPEVVKNSSIKEENHNYSKENNLHGDESRQKSIGLSRCFQLCCACIRCQHKCHVTCDSARHKFRIKRISFHQSHSQKQSHHHKETKAIKTLGVIMGCFTICWLPFFIIALLRPIICSGESGCSIPIWLTDICNWLGYANSFLNPVIYARFNRDFRKPFKSILCFKCNKINSRMRSESYVEQYGVLDHRIALKAGRVNTSQNSTSTSIRTSLVPRQNGNIFQNTDGVARTYSKDSNSVVNYDSNNDKYLVKICEDNF